VGSCRSVPHRTGKNCQSCHTRDKWWEAAGCVDHTDRVQLQRHAKLVSVQTQACPAVCSTQPANALHVLLCAIHTVSHFHSVTLEATVQLSGLTRVFVHVLAFSSTPSHANTAEFSSTPSHAAAAALALCSFHHLPRVLQLSDSCAPRHSAAAPHRAVMGIKRRPVERPVEHACAEAPRAPRN